MDVVQNRGKNIRRVALLAALAALLLPASASAADSIYWASESGFVGVGNLDGSGTASTLFGSEGGPVRGGDRPRGRQDLLGQLQLRRDPGREPGRHGHRLDPVRRRGRSCAGWRSTPRRTRSTGPTSPPTRSGSRNLDGSGTASTLFRRRGSAPSGVAIDPAANKIYWTNQIGPTGSGSGTWTARAPPRPCSAARPTRSGWRSTPRPARSTGPTSARCCSGPGTIRVGNLDGSGTASTLFGSEAGPAGVAIDPAANKIYWGNFGSGAIRVGNLDGTGTAATLFSGEGFAIFAALLRDADAAPGLRPSPASTRSARSSPAARGLGARPARSVPVQGAAQLRTISG